VTAVNNERVTVEIYAEKVDDFLSLPIRFEHDLKKGLAETPGTANRPQGTVVQRSACYQVAGSLGGHRPPPIEFDGGIMFRNHSHTLA
jgi:hypothetical protein